MKTELHDVDEQLLVLVQKLHHRIRTPIADRPRVILALCDVATFLDAIGAGQDVANLFSGLATMFHDLHKGARPPPLFVPAPSRGNRPEVSILWKLRGEVALGVDILIRSGMIQEKAVAAAAMYPGLNRLVTKGKANLKNSIASWYKMAKQADSGGAEVNPQMRAAFEISHNWEGVPPGSECEQSGRDILKHAAAMANSLPSIRLPART